MLSGVLASFIGNDAQTIIYAANEDTAHEDTAHVLHRSSD
jgi:hypothetical protein